MRPSTGQGVPAEPASRLLLVDTSAYFALVDRTDQHHLAASAFVRANDIPFVTTDLIIVETLNLVQARLGHSPALQLGRRLLNPALTSVLKVTDVDVAQAWRLFQRYRDKSFSFTDCTTFALMGRMRILTAFAFDVHFRQYGRCLVVP
jgi:predicted nucleic acid-binding protein